MFYVSSYKNGLIGSEDNVEEFYTRDFFRQFKCRDY